VDFGDRGVTIHVVYVSFIIINNDGKCRGYYSGTLSLLFERCNM
jgi:hypothetical protein